jgi:hypothetical protein
MEQGIGKRFYNIVDYTFGKKKVDELNNMIGSIDWSDDWESAATYALLPFCSYKFETKSDDSNAWYSSMGEKYMHDFSEALKSGKPINIGAFECTAHPNKMTKEFHVIHKKNFIYDESVFEYFKK